VLNVTFAGDLRHKINDQLDENENFGQVPISPLISEYSFLITIDVGEDFLGTKYIAISSSYQRKLL
jgi:hypothetical protein